VAEVERLVSRSVEAKLGRGSRSRITCFDFGFDGRKRLGGHQPIHCLEGGLRDPTLDSIDDQSREMLSEGDGLQLEVGTMPDPACLGDGPWETCPHSRIFTTLPVLIPAWGVVTTTRFS